MSLPPDKLTMKVIPVSSMSPLQIAMSRFKRNKMAVVSVVLLSIIIFLSLAAPLFTSQDPAVSDLYNTESAPNDDHFFGTNSTGQDIWSRLLYGGRISLLVAVTTMVFTLLIGGFFGSVSGYFGGIVDTLIMRLTDILLTMPTLLFVLFLVALLQKTNAWILIGALSLTAWSTTARIVRGEFLSLREREFVLSAKSVGCSDGRIIFRHIFPNVLAPLIVNATLLIAAMILVESSLSFLGFGVPPTTPSWGNMLNEAMNINVIVSKPWVWIPPGLFIVITVLSINFIGDGLRDALDMKSTRR